MAMKYQKGTVYPRRQKVKMWYGKDTVYLRNEEGKEVGKRRNVPLCPKAGTPKWQAEQMLHALILKETGTPAKTVCTPTDSRSSLQSRKVRDGGLRNPARSSFVTEVRYRSSTMPLCVVAARPSAAKCRQTHPGLSIIWRSRVP